MRCTSAAHRDLIADYVKAAHTAGIRTGYLLFAPRLAISRIFPSRIIPHERGGDEETNLHPGARTVNAVWKVDILWYDGGEDNWLGFGGLMWNLAKGGLVHARV